MAKLVKVLVYCVTPGTILCQQVVKVAPNMPIHITSKGRVYLIYARVEDRTDAKKYVAKAVRCFQNIFGAEFNRPNLRLANLRLDVLNLPPIQEPEDSFDQIGISLEKELDDLVTTDTPSRPKKRITRVTDEELLTKFNEMMTLLPREDNIVPPETQKPETQKPETQKPETQEAQEDPEFPEFPEIQELKKWVSELPGLPEWLKDPKQYIPSFDSVSCMMPPASPDNDKK